MLAAMLNLLGRNLGTILRAQASQGSQVSFRLFYCSGRNLLFYRIFIARELNATVKRKILLGRGWGSRLIEGLKASFGKKLNSPFLLKQ